MAQSDHLQTVHLQIISIQMIVYIRHGGSPVKNESEGYDDQRHAQGWTDREKESQSHWSCQEATKDADFRQADVETEKRQRPLIAVGGPRYAKCEPTELLI